MLRVVATLAALLGAAGIAVAGDKDKAESCDGGTIAMIQCLEAQRSSWDKKLNEAYKELLSTARPEQKAALRAAQRAWLSFRDANCQYYLKGEGSIARISAAACARDMTEKRARELDHDPYQ
jgi:uncharacterized protein YecT (DUF1311 family)